jgi:hypothetical protein
MIYNDNLVGLGLGRIKIVRSVYAKGTVWLAIALECDGIILVVTGVWDKGTSICRRRCRHGVGIFFFFFFLFWRWYH